MKLTKAALILGCMGSLWLNAVTAADKPPKRLTCCEQAAADGKECRHKCCVAAHKDGKSCEKCNPNKEDLKLIQKSAKSGKAADK